MSRQLQTSQEVAGALVADVVGGRPSMRTHLGSTSIPWLVCFHHISFAHKSVGSCGLQVVTLGLQDHACSGCAGALGGEKDLCPRKTAVVLACLCTWDGLQQLLLRFWFSHDILEFRIFIALNSCSAKAAKYVRELS